MAKIDDLLEIMQKLRDPKNGCPWDLEQTFASIVPHTIEEAYEVAECIEHRGLAGLSEELGDLLFQVVFYAQLAEEQELFDFDDVLEVISRKLLSRHPHVFGTASVGDAAEQTRRWEEHKATERRSAGAGRRVSELDGIPSLPALTRSRKLQQRAARVGFDWPDLTGVRQKVVEEFDELETAISMGDSPSEVEEEMGDLLFACVNWARRLGIEPESALRASARKFERRFHFIEKALAVAGSDMAEASLAEMNKLWEASKREDG